MRHSLHQSFIPFVNNILTHFAKCSATRFAQCVAIVIASIFAMSCSDDEQFTTDKSAYLRFSVDTVQFDTLFNSVSSETKRLIVYNRNDKGVRLNSVSLQSGGNAGFQMNVDGQYGATVKDVEILANDSIFIFIEALSKDNTEELLTHLEDKIIFQLESGMSQSIVLDCYGQKANILRHEVITEDRTLDHALPYVIYDSLVVAENATLTLTAGTKLYFHNYTNMIVRGTLKIEGELGNEVIIRGDRTNRLFPYLPYDHLNNQWGGIYLTSTCKGCDINYADIHSGNFGIDCDSIAGELTIQNSTIHNVAGDALNIRYTKALVANSQLSNAGRYCAFLTHAQAEFYHCTLGQFYPWYSKICNALFMVKKPEEKSAWANAQSNFYNSIITGSGIDEVFADFDSKNDTLRLHFYSSFVNTDISDSLYFTNCIAEDDDYEYSGYKNFKSFDTYSYVYDFRLDSMSLARGIADAKYSEKYPKDKKGVERKDAIDAGCYQSEYNKQ